MERQNKYWNLSWWFIFDYLDKEAHKTAIEQIWECETITAEIKYFWHIEEDDLENLTLYTRNKIWDNKIIVSTITKWKVCWNFTFIKIK